jgi:hypothetical protein
VTRAELLATLRTTPERVAEVTSGLTPAQAQQRPAPTEWSCVEILDHLVLGERDVILPRLRRIRAEDHPVFPSSAANRTGFAAAPRSGDVHERVAGFRAVRAETLGLLQSLAEAEWARLGTTPTRGTISIEGYARYLADHDLEHLEQLGRTRSVVAHR